ncbi:MAG: hypothetical protein GH158_03870 [Dehalococcoidia bacterium]|nr:hypothetical protein [Dehalococcoidia bacterium]
MLLIDGVKYELWTPQKEVEEFHPHVKEHYREIFGANSLFIEGKRLESESGKGSVPDGFVLTLGEATQWHIVEMELSTHQLYDHIVNQVGRFINGVKNTVTQRKIIEAIYQQIQENKQRKAEFEEAIGSGEIYKFLSDLISKSPVLTIIIEKRTRELDEALDILRYSPIKIVEFQTFTREGIGLAVHAHLFEPLYMPVISIKPEIVPLQPPENSLEVTLQPSYLESYCIYIPAAKKHLFPAFNTTLKLDSDIGPIETGFSINSWGIWLSKGLAPWFKSHPQLKAGDKLIITVIEPKQKYRLEIVK